MKGSSVGLSSICSMHFVHPPNMSGITCEPYIVGESRKKLETLSDVGSQQATSNVVVAYDGLH